MHLIPGQVDPLIVVALVVRNPLKLVEEEVSVPGNGYQFLERGI